jgi:hypothetical protein
MPKIAYKIFRFQKKTRDILKKANEIIDVYRAQGFELTLRQLYYQFVARDLLANNEKNYNRLGNIINDGRLAGEIDWNAIEDRTRNVRSNTHWSSPASIVRSAASQYRIDKWEGQRHRIEVWIEKDALVDVISQPCRKLDVPYFSCRGYVSSSEMWRGAQRLLSWESQDYTPIILHLGDHDPSGMDMTRDIQDRMRLFNSLVDVRRIALNMDQIRQLNPPPNPAKLTDSRCAQYIIDYGDESWELDALEPRFMADLVEEHILKLRDEEQWAKMEEQERYEKQLLNEAAIEVQERLEGNDDN